MIGFLTSSGCGRCKVIKQQLAQRGIEYKEFDTCTSEGWTLAADVGAKSAGILVDLDTMKIVELNTL